MQLKGPFTCVLPGVDPSISYTIMSVVKQARAERSIIEKGKQLQVSESPCVTLGRIHLAMDASMHLLLLTVLVPFASL